MLRDVRSRGGSVVAVEPDACSCPTIVEAALAARVVDACLPITTLAWLIGNAKPCTDERRAA
jgi:hypothetical protein